MNKVEIEITFDKAKELVEMLNIQTTDSLLEGVNLSLSCKVDINKIKDRNYVVVGISPFYRFYLIIEKSLTENSYP